MLPPGVKIGDGVCADGTEFHSDELATMTSPAMRIPRIRMTGYLMNVNFARPRAWSPCQGQTNAEFRGDAFAVTRT